MQYSYIQMFLNASFVVQAVVMILIFYSISSWGTICEKFFAISRETRKLKAFESFYVLNRTADTAILKILASQNEAYGNTMVYSSFRRARDFLVDTEQEHSSQDLKDLMNCDFQMKAKRMAAGIAKLSSISTIAPFIGLAGTVIGIMRAFEEIGAAHSVDLTVVAPGISEALMTTAIGLFAAIPSAIFYNIFSSQINYIYSFSEDFIDDISKIMFNSLYAKK